MAENSTRLPELPDSLRAMREEFQRLGREGVKIPLQGSYGRNKRFINAANLDWVYAEPPGSKTKMWLLGTVSERGGGRPLYKTLVPVATYGDSSGKLFVLPIPANKQALANGADIFDRLSTASRKAGRTAIADRLRDNWAQTLRGSNVIIEQLYPTGRERENSLLNQVLEKLEVIPSKGERAKPISSDLARFAVKVKSLSPQELKQVFNEADPKKAVALVNEGVAASRSRSERLSTPSRPTQPIDPQTLVKLAEQGLPAEPSEAVRPINRAAAEEAKKFQRQRNEGQGTDTDQVRGAKSATPAQRNTFNEVRSRLNAKLAPSPDDTPQIEQLKSRLREQLRLGLPPEIRAGTSLAKVGDKEQGFRVERRGREALSGWVPRTKMRAALDTMFQVENTFDAVANPKTRRLSQAGISLENLTRALKPLDPAATPADVGEVLRTRTPNTVTMAQAGTVGAAGAAARETTQTLRDMQERLRIAGEEKGIVEIEKTLREVAGLPASEKLTGGLSKVKAEALKNIRNPNAKVGRATKLAMSFGFFGSPDDLKQAKADFIDAGLNEFNTITELRKMDDPASVRKADNLIRRVSSRLRIPPADLSDPARFKSVLGRVFDIDTEARALSALADRHTELSRASVAPTSPAAKQGLYEAGYRPEDITARSAARTGERTLRQMGAQAPKSTLTVGALQRLATKTLGEVRAPQPAPGKSRMVPNGGMPSRPEAPVNLSAGGQFRVGPEVGGLQPANLPQLPAGSGPAVPFAYGVGSTLMPLQAEQLRRLAPPRQFSPQELANLPSIAAGTARPTSVAPELRREGESLFVRSDIPEPRLQPKPKARMRRKLR